MKKLLYMVFGALLIGGPLLVYEFYFNFPETSLLPWKRAKSQYVLPNILDYKITDNVVAIVTSLAKSELEEAYVQ